MRKALVLPLIAGLAAPIALVSPAQADGFPRKAVQTAIENQIKDVVKQAATVKCPARSGWSQGAVFFCTAKPMNGAASYRVKVTLGSEKKHKFRWLKVS